MQEFIHAHTQYCVHVLPTFSGWLSPAAAAPLAADLRMTILLRGWVTSGNLQGHGHRVLAARPPPSVQGTASATAIRTPDVCARPEVGHA